MEKQPINKIEFEQKGIGEILAHNWLKVPLNQREYSWEIEHVRDLFNDFRGAIEGNKNYFLGTIVLTKGEGKVLEVSDGQQRLATTTVLLAAIRDYFFNNGDKSKARTIEWDYLMKTEISTDDVIPHLKLNVDDNFFFTKFVLSSPDSSDRNVEPKKKSHERLKIAAETAANFLHEMFESVGNKEPFKTNRILEIVEFIHDRAEVIKLVAPDDINAFLMFETLNDRGLKASQADLLKNHILSFSRERINEAQQKWAQMVGILESLGRGDITVTYLHHVLIIKYGPMKEREIFDKVKEFVNNQNRSLEFLEELTDDVNDYAALFNSDHKKWNEYGTRTKKNITTIINDLRVLQIVPLMFAVSRYFPKEEAKLAFRMLLYWSVRFLVYGGRGGLLDRNYALCAHEIGSGKIKNTKQLLEKMEEVVPSDAMFEAAFAEVHISQVFRARYYLRAMEQQKKGVSEAEWVPSEDEQQINLEHIMPDNPQDKWPELDPELAGAYYSKIGNMVMLQAKKNSMIGNNSFEEKKKVLKDSTFLLTSEVAVYPKWGSEQINDRQKKLAKLAVETWPRFPK
ncbi:MAG: DUF262 domain-containing HNH endonuclease family protein [Nitrospirota bacterium]